MAFDNVYVQVIKESLRMFPVAATGLSRCTDADTVLGGYHIPAGTEVQVEYHSLLHEREILLRMISCREASRRSAPWLPCDLSEGILLQSTFP